MSDSPTDEEEDLAEEDFNIQIVEPFTLVDVSTIAAKSPLRYINAVKQAWTVKAAISRTLQAQAPAKTGAKAGEPKPDKDIQHLWLFCYIKGVAGFIAHWEGTLFKGAQVWDVAGWPMELWAKYEPKHYETTRNKDEPERPFQERVRKLRQRADRMDAEYNDGEFWVNHRPRFIKPAIDFEEWLADLVPSFTPKKRPEKKPTQAEATVSDLLEIGEWTG